MEGTSHKEKEFDVDWLGNVNIEDGMSSLICVIMCYFTCSCRDVLRAAFCNCIKVAEIYSKM